MGGGSEGEREVLSCVGKVGHASRSEAERALSAAIKHGGGIKRRGGSDTRVTVYRCDFCALWHYGHHVIKTRKA